MLRETLKEATSRMRRSAYEVQDARHFERTGEERSAQFRRSLASAQPRSSEAAEANTLQRVVAPVQRLIQRFLGALLLGAGMLISALTHAEEAIGYVKTASGEAYVITAQQRTTAQPGTPVFLGSKLKTGTNGSIGVTLKDETIVACGPDTELTIDEYLYRPAEGKLALVANLLKGSLNYISGVIAKLKPDAVSVKTPTGTIGIRGTQFVAKVVAEEQP